MSLLITLAPISFLRSLVVRAVHRHRTDGPYSWRMDGGPYSWRIFLNCSRLEFRHVYNFHSILRHINPLENSPHRMKCHKIVMTYPQPIRRHYHPNDTLITLAPPISYLRSLVVRAVHRHRTCTGVGSISVGGPYSWRIFLKCSRLEFRHVCNLPLTH